MDFRHLAKGSDQLQDALKHLQQVKKSIEDAVNCTGSYYSSTDTPIANEFMKELVDMDKINKLIKQLEKAIAKPMHDVNSLLSYKDLVVALERHKAPKKARKQLSIIMQTLITVPDLDQLKKAVEISQQEDQAPF